MAEITVVERTLSGVSRTSYTAASPGGDSFRNNALISVRAKNADTQNAKVITVPAAKSVLQVDTSGPVPVSNLSVSVAASAEVEFVVPYGTYGNHPTMTYDSSSGLSVQVTRQPII